MSDFAWGRIAPGQTAMEAETAGGGFACLVQLGGIQPDVVNLPPELGGGTARVIDRIEAPCPKQPKDHGQILHHVLERGINVTGCKTCGEWLWYSASHREGGEK